MADKTGITFTETISMGLKAAEKSQKIANRMAWGAFGLQLLNNVVNGSPQEPTVPPILHGFLRASGSVFFESELLGTASKYGYSNKSADVKPNESYNGKKNEVTIGFNAPYATKMHETSWTPGPTSAQSGDVGNKFLEKHLKKDRKELFQLYADIHKKNWKN